MRLVLKIVLVVYIVGAVISAALMKTAIPSLNAFGMIYIGLTWPAAIVGIDIVPDPGPFADMMFTFE